MKQHKIRIKDKLFFPMDKLITSQVFSLSRVMIDKKLFSDIWRRTSTVNNRVHKIRWI